MNKKRTLLTVVALILVCALSIMGTLAFLESTTNTVTNTFVAAGGPGPFIDEDKDGNKLFELLEYEVTQSSTGKYTQTTNEVTANEYDVMPGTTIPKQVFVKLSRTAAVVGGEPVDPAPAYLYLEVIDALPDAYNWEIEDTNWTIIPDLTGPNGGGVYLYTGSLADTNHVITGIAAYSSDMIDIIKEDKITVADDAELDADAVTLSFNAFLAQASTGTTDDPAAVFTACFAGAGSQSPVDPAPENP